MAKKWIKGGMSKKKEPEIMKRINQSALRGKMYGHNPKPKTEEE